MARADALHRVGREGCRQSSGHGRPVLGVCARCHAPRCGTDEVPRALRPVIGHRRPSRRAPRCAEHRAAPQFETGTQSFVDIVETFAPQEWDAVGESPLGHLPARLLFGHAFWDSWLHERDIFVPLGTVPVEPDELLAVTCFCLLFAGLQGGLLGDERATGPRLLAPVDVRLRFDELPDTALRVEYDTGARIDLIDRSTASPAGSAVALVDGFTGRGPTAALAAELPADLAAHLGRAAHVL